MNPVQLEALVLVGGLGRRLRSSIVGRPKPMAEVAGRPFLEWLILAAKERGVGRFVLCTGYLAEHVETYFGNGSKWGVSVEYSRETTPLGTGGALKLALDKTERETLLAFNGDSYCPCDLHRLLTEHSRTAAAATLWVVGVEDCSRYGAVSVADDGSVTAFREKEMVTKKGLINAGIYAIQRTILESIPVGRPVSLEHDVFPGLIGEKLHAVAGEGPFIDIGTPESYARAQDFVLRELTGYKSHWERKA